MTRRPLSARASVTFLGSLVTLLFYLPGTVTRNRSEGERYDHPDRAHHPPLPGPRSGRGAGRPPSPALGWRTVTAAAHALGAAARYHVRNRRDRHGITSRSAE